MRYFIDYRLHERLEKWTYQKSETWDLVLRQVGAETWDLEPQNQQRRPKTPKARLQTKTLVFLHIT